MNEQTVGMVDNKEYIQKLPIKKDNYSFLLIVRGLLCTLVIFGILLCLRKNKEKLTKEQPDLGIPLNNVNV